jgi:hypothetical protein
MDPFWQIEEASLAGVQKSQRRASAALPNGVEAGVPFLTQIEQTLGERTLPDSEFFIDSWTVGLAAASENFLRRQEQPKISEHEIPAWRNFSSFTPWFVAGAEASAASTWPPCEVSADARAMADRRWVRDVKEEDCREVDEVEIECPLTRESACQVLGVAATSTREQIRAAYRKMASRYHPDRLAQGALREQKLAGDRMASINEAYRLLSKDLAGTWSPSYVS